MLFKLRDTCILVNAALKASPTEFLQLIERVGPLQSKEDGRVGSLRIIGKLVEVPPVGEAIIVGDLHGDLESLVHIIEKTNFVKKAGKEDVLLVFLGDYGDRGHQSPEVYYVILKLKERFPERVLLIRGNHEGPDDLLASPHDMPFQLMRKFGEVGSEVYSGLRGIFNQLHNAVLINQRYILLHGGAPSLVSKIADVAYAHEKHPSESHLEEILWNDPLEGIKGTYPSPRGAGRLFGEDVTQKLLNMFNVKALIRAHEPNEEGFKTNHSGKVLTLFSRKGPPYHNNCGAYLHLNLSQKVKDSKQLVKYARQF